MNTVSKWAKRVGPIVLVGLMGAESCLSGHFGVGDCSKWNSCPNGMGALTLPALLVMLIAAYFLSRGSRVKFTGFATVALLIVMLALFLTGCAAYGDPTPAGGL